MNWFKRKIKPSRPPENFKPLRIEFIGEQLGLVEDELKTKFCEVFARTPTIQSAYLARLSYGEPDYSVGLCLRSSVGNDMKLKDKIGEIFAETFSTKEYIDIFFMREDQENELRKVCKAFYKKG